MAQNNFGIRVRTSSPNGYVRVYPLLRFPLTISGGPGVGQPYLANIQNDFYDGKLVLSLFDAGDDTGDPSRTGYIQILAPPDATHPTIYPTYFDIYKHDYHWPPGPDAAFPHTFRLQITTDGNPQSDYNDEWADTISNIPTHGEYEGGFWQIQYIGYTNHHDRMTMQIKFCTPNSTTVTIDCSQVSLVATPLTTRPPHQPIVMADGEVIVCLLNGCGVAKMCIAALQRATSPCRATRRR